MNHRLITSSLLLAASFASFQLVNAVKATPVPQETAKAVDGFLSVANIGNQFTVNHLAHTGTYQIVAHTTKGIRFSKVSPTGKLVASKSFTVSSEIASTFILL